MIVFACISPSGDQSLAATSRHADEPKQVVVQVIPKRRKIKQDVYGDTALCSLSDGNQYISFQRTINDTRAAAVPDNSMSIARTAGLEGGPGKLYFVRGNPNLEQFSARHLHS